MALAALIALFAGAAEAGPGAQAILDANRAATGDWTGKATLKADYAYSGQGLSGTITILSDLASGRFVETYDLPPVQGAHGFDGHEAWTRDPSGTADIEAGGAARALAVNKAYRRAHLWWRADRGDAAIADTGMAGDGERRFDVLSVTPDGGVPFQAWFDADTHLLARIVETRDGVATTVTLSGYVSYDGTMLAGMRVTSTGDHAYDLTQRLSAAQFLPPQPASAYAMPQVLVSDWRIEGGHETTIPFTLVNNHIYAEVTVNGAPFRFIFDTGGANVVTPKTAAALGLTSTGDMRAQGAGEETMKAGYTKIGTLRIGKAAIDNQIFTVMPLDTLAPVEGIDISGMVGFETFRRFVTRIDYGTGTITLIAPGQFDPKDAGTPISFTLNGRIAEIEGRFEGIAGRFEIDTGSRAALILTRPFVEAHDLRASHPGGVQTLSGWGIGGPTTGYVTRGRMLTMGPIQLPDIVTTFSDQTRGLFASDSYAGNIGGGILKRFVVTLDYDHRLFYLKPLPVPLADSGGYDRAGMWINRAEDGFAIVHVTRDSPAEEAGLEKGDVIVAVDGTAADQIALSALRDRLRSEPVGTAIRFTIRRNGESQMATVTLRDLIGPGE